MTKKKPFLGICVGMQVLAQKGHEFGEFEGLGWVPGTVEKLQVADLPLPHIGWNNISVKHASPLLRELENEPDFYFLHSFAFKPKHDECAVAVTQYGSEFCSVLSRENIHGVQFHPEKSQRTGKRLVLNFLELS